MRHRLVAMSKAPALRATAGLTGVQVVAMVLALATGPIQARGLGPELRGELAMILIIGQIGAFLSDAGTMGYVTREHSRGRGGSVLLGSVAPLLLGSTLVILLVSYPVALLASSGGRVLFFLVLTQMLLLPLAALVQVGSGLAAGAGDIRTLAVTRLIAAVVPFVGLVGLWMFDAITLWSVAACYFVAILLSAIPMVRLWSLARPLERDREVTRGAWRFGRSAWLNVLLTIGNVRVDGLLVAGLLGFHALGLYAVATTLAMLPSLVPAAATLVVSRRVAADELGPFTARSIRIVFTLAWVVAVAIALMAPVVVPFLFGREFEAATGILRILLMGTVAAAASASLSNATSLAGRPLAAAVCQGIGVAVMVLGMVTAAKPWGVEGVAAASALGYMVSFGLLVGHAVKRSGIPPSGWLLIRPADLRGLGGGRA